MAFYLGSQFLTEESVLSEKGGACFLVGSPLNTMTDNTCSSVNFRPAPTRGASDLYAFAKTDAVGRRNSSVSPQFLGFVPIEALRIALLSY